jgi:hypothetical protein
MSIIRDKDIENINWSNSSDGIKYITRVIGYLNHTKTDLVDINIYFISEEKYYIIEIYVDYPATYGKEYIKIIDGKEFIGDPVFFKKDYLKLFEISIFKVINDHKNGKENIKIDESKLPKEWFIESKSDIYDKKYEDRYPIIKF